MSALLNLMGDVEATLGHRSGQERARTLSRITDLFVRDADTLDAAGIELFDQVIGRFVLAIEVRARAELAERLSRIAKAPPGVLRDLALDREIVVARPVLMRAVGLDDQDLMIAATERTREHRLAVSHRRHVSEMVADTLVVTGDIEIRRAVAGNAGVRLSAVATATLIEESRSDEPLQDLLGARADLTAAETGQLVSIAKETVRRRLLASLPTSQAADIAAALEAGTAAVENALQVAPGRDWSVTLERLKSITTSRPLNEGDLERYAAEGLEAETICTVAALTGLSNGAADRIFSQRDADILLVVGKAKSWSWRTMRALLRLRRPALTERHHFSRAQSTFDAIATVTAERVLQFLTMRDAADRDGSARGRR